MQGRRQQPVWWCTGGHARGLLQQDGRVPDRPGHRRSQWPRCRAARCPARIQITGGVNQQLEGSHVQYIHCGASAARRRVSTQPQDLPSTARNHTRSKQDPWRRGGEGQPHGSPESLNQGTVSQYHVLWHPGMGSRLGLGCAQHGDLPQFGKSPRQALVFLMWLVYAILLTRGVSMATTPPASAPSLLGVNCLVHVKLYGALC